MTRALITGVTGQDGSYLAELLLGRGLFHASSNEIFGHRQAYGLFCCCGILFNHESPRRGEEFVVRKIARGAAAIKLGLQDELRLGNLDPRRDWGFAPDYVEAMWLMLQRDEPDDYVLATGIAHSVRDCVAVAFEHVGLDWSDHVKFDDAFDRPAESESRVGDASKARRELGWAPRTGFEAMIAQLVDHDLARLRA